MEWPFVGRKAELRALTRAIGGTRPGVVLSGLAGVGKSRLAQEMMAVVPERGRPLVVLASMSSRGIPLGPFAPHLRCVSEPYPTEAALLSAAASELRSVTVPILIDDAHHLDPLSATLVHQTIRMRSAPVVVTVRSGEQAPDAIERLWKDDILSHVTIGPLTKDETHRLVRAALGAEVDEEVLHGLWRLSLGNVLYLRHLVEGAVHDGSLEQVEGRWELTGPLAPPDELADLLMDHLARAGSGIEDLMGLLAVAEPLEFDILASITDPALVSAAEGAHLIRVTRSHNRLVASPTHPLLTEVILERTPTLELRKLRERVAVAIAQTGMRRSDDALRCSRLMLDAAATIPLVQAIRAAEAALSRFDAALAERILASAREADDSHPARLAHARALRQLHRPDDAFSVLLLDMARSRSDAETADAAVLAIDTLLFHGRHDEAAAVARRAMNSLEDPVARARVQVEAVLLALIGDRVGRAVDLGEQVLATEGVPDSAVLEVLVITTIAQPLTGRLNDIHGRIDRAIDLAETPTAPPLTRHQLAINRHLTFQCEGDLVAADSFSARHLDEVRDLGGPLAGVGMIAIDTLFERGRFDRMREVAQESMDASETFDPFLNRPHLPLWATTCALQVGWVDLAAEWMAAAATDGDDLRWVIRRGRIAAWNAIRDNDLGAARSHYRQIIDYVEPDGARLWLLFALADALRLGHPALVAEHLDHLRGHMEGEAALMLSAHADALAEGDAERLEQISDRYGQLGWRLRAAEASADAAGVHSSRGHDRAAACASTRARHIAEHFTALTPPLTRMPEGLTDRKRQVARLAAEGAHNREIADRLYVSVRTVENHLSQTYRILGLDGREQLIALLGPDHDPR